MVTLDIVGYPEHFSCLSLCFRVSFCVFLSVCLSLIGLSLEGIILRKKDPFMKFDVRVAVHSVMAPSGGLFRETKNSEEKPRPWVPKLHLPVKIICESYWTRGN